MYQAAAGQHGLITHAQALAHMTADQLKTRVQQGRFEPVRRGVLRIAGSPESWAQRLLAACLAAGPSACASFRSAASLWQLETFGDRTLEITVPGNLRPQLRGVATHRTHAWGEQHVGRIDGIPVTSAARTLCDMTVWMPAWGVERAVDDLLRRKAVSLRSLALLATQLDGQGRRRCTVMREVLATRLPGYEPGESAPEVRIVRLLVAAGLPRPVQQHGVRINGRALRLDLAYPDALVAIEYDGWDFHSSRTAFDSDRARANELELVGWTVLRFTSRSSDTTIVTTVRTALARRGVS